MLFKKKYIVVLKIFDKKNIVVFKIFDIKIIRVILTTLLHTNW